MQLRLSLVVDGQFIDDVEVADHDAELLEGDLAVEVRIGLHNGPVDKLLELDVVQVGAYHHLENLEELSVRNEAVIVDIVDLEGEAQLFLLAGACGQRVEALHEFEERDVAVVVAIKNCDHSFHKWVVGQFYARKMKRNG